MVIMLEDMVIFLWRSAFGTSTDRWKSLVGYVWVVCSFWFSLPMAADVILKLRKGEVSLFAWTLWGPLLDRIFV